MIRTKRLVTEIQDIPSTWVFKYYLGLKEDLTGQDVMIKSIFNPKDSVPSLSVYVWKNHYKYNDFSTGVKGDKIDLVMRKYSITYPQAIDKIIEDYNHYLLSNHQAPIEDFKERAKYKVTSWERRKWTLWDKEYWTRYEIGSKELERFAVFPLKEYKLSNQEKDLTIQGSGIYGYFTATGELYQLYQPMSGKLKFMNVSNHVRGLDQLQYSSQVLIITKALKDVICLFNLGYESVASQSENVLLGQHLMSKFKQKYKIIRTLLDNDEAGERAMTRYLEEYEIEPMKLNLSKDPSDSIKDHGSLKVKQVISSLL